VELKRQENYVEQSRVVDGAVEFVSYAVAVLMAADRANSLSKELASFSRWLFRHAYNGYFESQKDFPPFDEQERLYKQQKEGSAWSGMRFFLKEKLDYQIPSGIEPEDGDDLDWVLGPQPLLECSLVRRGK
jgi:hypothetical protein